MFQKDYKALKHVTLNPERHSALNAYEHCEMVVERVAELCKKNQLVSKEAAMLVSLAKVHDIGKVHGTAKPGESVALLKKYGEHDENFLNMVKYHDVNLPWFISMTRGQTPSDKAWRKLTGKVDLRLLCIFMIADRVDCPGGWSKNNALVWFLDEAKNKQHLEKNAIKCD